jgi:hypothetical protein
LPELLPKKENQVNAFLQPASSHLLSPSKTEKLA